MRRTHFFCFCFFFSDNLKVHTCNLRQWLSVDRQFYWPALWDPSSCLRHHLQLARCATCVDKRPPQISLRVLSLTALAPSLPLSLPLCPPLCLLPLSFCSLSLPSSPCLPVCLSTSISPAGSHSSLLPQ